jgi:hypothetical protein
VRLVLSSPCSPTAWLLVLFTVTGWWYFHLCNYRNTIRQWAKILHSTFRLPCCYWTLFLVWHFRYTHEKRQVTIHFSLHQRFLKALENKEILLYNLTNNNGYHVLNSYTVWSQALWDKPCIILCSDHY